MKYKVLYFNSIFLLMLITGVFWGTWFTLTRSIEKFSSEEFIHIGKIIITNVAVPMSIIMPLGILFIIGSLFLYQNKKTVAFYFGIVSFILIVIVLLITLIVLVPIDNDIKEWTTANLPQEWENIRSRWKGYHALRTLLSVISFACYSLFTLVDRPLLA